jgi:predicted ATP-dependent endonuclease of OLD family
MQLARLKLYGFQCFSPESDPIDVPKCCYLIGPNGSGKTAVLTALARLFGFSPGMRKILPSDFHIPADEESAPSIRSLFIEADFLLPECADESADHSTIPPFFGHMRLDEDSGIPRVRYRISAEMGPNGDIEEKLVYVNQVDANDEPVNTSGVPRAERNYICVHYIPAKRDPADHIAFGTSALLGRLLRANEWTSEEAQLTDISDAINSLLTANGTVQFIQTQLAEAWQNLARQVDLSQPTIEFTPREIASILRQVTVSFQAAGITGSVDYKRLSDGQKSLLYLSLVLAVRNLETHILDVAPIGLDPEKAQIPVFSIVALEEPENSLSPHFLGRIVSALQQVSGSGRTQPLIATHSPSMLRRVDPRDIRHSRLNRQRMAKITSLCLPPDNPFDPDTAKYIREAVQAFPEIYFARFVLLCEGSSEEIVLPRILRALNLAVDEHGIAVAPLGGRHVNHFWRLLHGLGIPHATLLDLDAGRYQAGWGRIKYAGKQLEANGVTVCLPEGGRIETLDALPPWNNTEHPILKFENFIQSLERYGVFFSAPIDLDFAMLRSFPAAYGLDHSQSTLPDDSTIKSVLGKSFVDSNQFSQDELRHFDAYHSLFKTSSKPGSHLSALATLGDQDLAEGIPETYRRLTSYIQTNVDSLPA